MRAVLFTTMVFSFCMLVFAGMPSHAQNIFLSPNKDKANTQRPEVPNVPAETRNSTRSVIRPKVPETQIAPVAPYVAKPSAQPAVQQSTVQYGAHRFNPDKMPCTKKDLKAYKQMETAFGSAFSASDDIINSPSKIAKTAKDRDRAAEQVSKFLLDEKNANAFSALLARCGEEIFPDGG